MKSKFVDTNIFIRFATKDDPKKAERCYKLFKSCKDKKVMLTTSESVVSEVVYILSSKSLYRLEGGEVYEKLLPILSISSFKIPAKKRLLKALEIFASSKIDFEDCLTVAYMAEKGIEKLYSYDKDFDSFTDIKRLEP